MKRMYILLVILTVFMLIGCSKQTEWAHWRGPNDNGTTHDADWSPDALEDGAKILWQAEIGKGHSAVTVHGNRLYTMGNHQAIVDGDTLEKDVVYCLDTKTGHPVWTYEYDCAADTWPGPCSTPVIDCDRVYTLSREGHLFCFNRRNGDVIWQKHLVQDSLATGRLLSSSATIDGDLVLFNLNRSGTAFNKHTGELVWTSKITDAAPSTPVLYNHDNRRFALLYNRRNLYAVESQTGEILWEEDIRASTCDPIILDDKILYTGHGTALFQFGMDSLKTIWRNNDVRWGFQNAVVVNDHLYGFTWCHWQDKTQPFHCVDLSTGEMKWKEDLVVWGSLIAADGKLIILEGQGKLTIAEASPEGYKIIASTQVVPMADNTGLEVQDQCHCWTHPVLAGGKIYARNNFGTLVCVDMRI